MRSNTAEQSRFVRFGVVGLLNTAVGYGVILAALQLGFGDIIANVSGYAAGLALGFILNSRWTFRWTSGFATGVLARYAMAFVLAYGVNLAILLSFRALGLVDNPLTHLVGICAYSVIFYLCSARFVFIAANPEQVGRGGLSIGFFAKHWPEAGVLTGVVGAYLLLRNIPVSHDVVWQMWIARQLLGGAALYVDILELNPPLWFWMAVPVEWTAQAFGIPPTQAIVAAVFSMIGAALFLLAVLLADKPPLTRAMLLASALLALVLLPLAHFAQREHLSLIGAVAYLALIARRIDGREIDWRAAATTGLIGGLGFALKHYFVLVPILLELWLLHAQRRKWVPLRPETLVLSVGAICYAAAVLLFAPAFFTTMVPMVNAAYDGYEVPLLTQIAKPFVSIWVFTLVVLWLQRGQASSLTVASIIAAAAFCAAYFMQGKGWPYHALPVSALLFFATATLLPNYRWTDMRVAASALLIVCLLAPVCVGVASGLYRNPAEARVSELLRDSKPGTVAVALTGSPSRMWPMVENAGLVWPSRHYAFWMTYALFAEEKQNGMLSPELAAMADTVRRQTVEDLACNPPEIILVDDFSPSRYPGFDMLRFFRENEDFKSLFSHYTLDRRSGRYTFYKKSSDWPRPPASRCRKIH